MPSRPSKVVPFVWLKKDAQAAAKFYTSLFPRSKIVSDDGMSCTFTLDGMTVMALNGGPHYKLSPAFSLFVECRTQKEIDRYWTKLSKGGKIMQCGWLTDRFGVSWQIIPSILGDLLGDSNREKADRAMKAMLKMKKIDIVKLKEAHAGRL